MDQLDSALAEIGFELPQPMQGSGAMGADVDTISPPQNHFVVFGKIDDHVAKKISLSLTAGVDFYEEIHLYLAACDAEMPAALHLYNLIRGLAIPVVIYNTGFIRSAVMLVFLAAERRYCSPHSHFVLGAIRPDVERDGIEGNVYQWRQALDSLLEQDAIIEAILRDRANIPEDVLRSRYSQDVMISPADAVSYGVAAEVRQFEIPKGQSIQAIV